MDLSLAIEYAHTVLGWQENLMEEEIPPEWMWPINHELEAWFEKVKADRAEKYGVNRDDRQEVPMMGNELAAERKKA